VHPHFLDFKKIVSTLVLQLKKALLPPFNRHIQMAKKPFHITQELPTSLLVAVDAPYNLTVYMDTYFEEFANLAKTAGIPTEHMIIIKLRTIDSGFFFSKGKLQEIKDSCQEFNVAQVIVSERLSPMQIRNLEDFLECKVVDRTDLILDIFEKAALSSEGKTQVAIARLQHKKARLAGRGVHLDQQAGFTGSRGGAGETAKERERRHIENQILTMKRSLESLQNNRAVQRKRRLENKVPLACLIGYTNAGKSTILNALTKSNVLAEDKLFATLDTTTRALFIGGTQKGVLSDTVGFIQQLPHHLIEAFKSTLSELQFADLLLHVIDASDPNWKSHISIVLDILLSLGVEKKMLYVFNKIDKVDTIDELTAQAQEYQPHVLISAKNKEGLEPLIDYLKAWETRTEPA